MSRAGLVLLGLACLVGCQSTPKTPDEAVRVANQDDTEQVHTELVRQMIAQRKYFAARAHVDALALEHGETPEIRLLRADCMRHLGEFEAAQAGYQSLLNGPYAAEAAHGMGLLLASRHLTAAISYLQRAVFLRPTHAAARNDLGYAMMLMGQYDKALRELSTALELAPGDDRPLRNLVLLHHLRGDHARAATLGHNGGLSDTGLAQLRRQAEELALDQAHHANGQ